MYCKRIPIFIINQAKFFLYEFYKNQKALMGLSENVDSCAA